MHKNTIGTSTQAAISKLEAGMCVAIPTETVYGLAANALNPTAVARIFEIKNRPTFDPLIVHIGRLEDVEKLTSTFPEKARALAEKFWPGPLTIVLPKKPIVPDIVTSGLDTVGIRMPAHPLTLELLRNIDFPLAAPSANPFGFVSPTQAAHVADQLGSKVPYILDGGACTVGIESTIVSFSAPEARILRRGGLSQADIQSVIGSIEIATASTSNPAAPGMLISHYSPGKPLFFGDLDELIQIHDSSKFHVLAFRDQRGHPGCTLSASGSFNEAARNLFSALRELSKADCDIILAEKLPDKELGPAINDRLQRASGKMA